MSNTLYEINAEMRAITDLIILAEGVVTPELEAAQEACDMSWFAKLEAYNKVIHNKQYTVDLANAEIERLKQEVARIEAINKTRENDLGRLVSTVKGELEDKGEKKIDFAVGGFTVKKGTVVVEIINEALIPFDWMTTVPETQKPDKNAMKEYLKKDEANVIAGAVLKTNDTTLAVR